ncbi:MAG: hypothetical protein QXS54_03315 [Candidatus Methanomethylicaceae archaeon]
MVFQVDSGVEVFIHLQTTLWATNTRTGKGIGPGETHPQWGQVRVGGKCLRATTTLEPHHLALYSSICNKEGSSCQLHI